MASAGDHNGLNASCESLAAGDLRGTSSRRSMEDGRWSFATPTDCQTRFVFCVGTCPWVVGVAGVGNVNICHINLKFGRLPHRNQVERERCYGAKLSFAILAIWLFFLLVLSFMVGSFYLSFLIPWYPTLNYGYTHKGKRFPRLKELFLKVSLKHLEKLRLQCKKAIRNELTYFSYYINTKNQDFRRQLG